MEDEIFYGQNQLLFEIKLPLHHALNLHGLISQIFGPLLPYW